MFQHRHLGHVAKRADLRVVGSLDVALSKEGKDVYDYTYNSREGP